MAAKDSINITGSLSIPILAPQAWADWSRAADQLDTSKLSERDVQRTVAITTARAYLTVFAQKRQVEVNRQARDNSLAHMQYADARLRGGIGNRVDWARAGQDLEQNEALLQTSYANLYRTQEALGILLGENEPVDTEDIPQIPGMPTLEQALEESQGPRRHPALPAAGTRRRSLAQPELDGVPPEHHPRRPAVLPGPLVPHDAQDRLAGRRPSSPGTSTTAGRATAAPTSARRCSPQARIQLDATLRPGELRRPRRRWTTWSAPRPRWSGNRTAARLASDAMRLADVAYRAGASTNLELIDAQRRARDAETLANIAEDNQRQAFIDLLAAAGRFPAQLSAAGVQSLTRQDAVRNFALAPRALP